MDGCNLQKPPTKIEKWKNHRTILDFRQFFSIFLEKLLIRAGLFMEKKFQSEIQKKMGENVKTAGKSKKTSQIFRFSAKFFNLFVKVTFQCRLMGKENEHGTKSGKKPYGRFYGKSSEKHMQKIGNSGKKRCCQKEVFGISESVKNSVFKAISDETR